MEIWATKNWVWCLKCLEWIDAANKASFVNIEEDIHGIDNMTFICDKCGQESESKVIAKETQPKIWKYGQLKSR